MIKLGYGRLFRQSWHPSLEELMRYVDGELGVRAGAAVRSHLKRCWACRAKREKLDHLISAFMRNQQSVLDTFPAPSLRLRERFAKRLDRIEQRSGWRAWLSRLTAGVQGALLVSRLPVKIGLGVLSVLLAAVLLVQVTSVERVSAKELLRRAETAESRRIQHVSLPVVYQRLTVRRLSAAPQAESTAIWEIWHDPTHRRFSERIEDTGKARRVRVVKANGSSGNALSEPAAGDFPDVLRELDEVFHENRFDRQRPLSASGYQAWRGTVARKTEQVRKVTLAGGIEVLKITTSSQAEDRPKRIVEAAILIRAEDWHPVQEQLKVRQGAGISEYELTEAAFGVLALNAVPASIFAGLEPPPLPQPPQTVTDKIETSTEPDINAGQLKVAEMEAAYALHRLRACLGEAVEIHHSPQGTIQVEGLVETFQRREEIANALAGISLVRVRLQTVPEAMKDTRAASDTSPERQAPERPQPESPAALEVQSARLPLQDFLEPYYSAPAGAAGNGPGPGRAGTAAQVRQQIAELSKEVVSLSESASAEMWALRHLAERYPSSRAQALPPGARWLLEAMVRDHLTELKSLMSRVRRLLEPVLTAFATAHGGVPTARSSPEDLTMRRSWDAGVLALFQTAEQIERLNLGLFADASLPQAETGWATQTLLAALASFERDVKDLEKNLAQEFTTLAKQ